MIFLRPAVRVYIIAAYPELMQAPPVLHFIPQ